ncbi:NADH dehydrogenase [ubiquinone] flavoprotein 3, mitochondrial [Pyxicephalus adspersus]|uniref:NADH dehydrogenase [ubiquinone] flavoprotein 3, mitochondrial n=1 Tax=Pyxicephalus adspersus TaxID=30357 RepID=A0AAV3B8V6_PYXAD|nr:TPA: hypothetical protein GDO54_002202 [Pyxicephalus adspersus]
MAALPVLRSVRRLRSEVALLPRIVITPRRAESGGKGAERPEINKTLLSFPAKQVRPPGGSTMGTTTILQQLGMESSVDPELGPERSEPDREEESSSSSDSDSDQEDDKKKVTETPKKKELSGQMEEKKAGEGLRNIALAVGKQVKRKPQSVETTPSGGQDLTGEHLVDTAPTVGKQVKRKPQSVDTTPSGGQDLTGELLVEVAPAVGKQVKRKPQSVETTPSGGQDLTGEHLVDVAPAVGKQVKRQPESVETTPSGGQDLAGEDLVDVAPGAVREMDAPSPGCAEQRLAGSQDVPEMSASDESRDLPGEPSASLDLQAPCEELPAAVSLTPPPSATPPPEQPFDNSKYQNQQHFLYTPFTFVDYDVELSKFRLPQPSSGRPSPWH